MTTISLLIEFDPASGQVVGLKGPTNPLLANFILDRAKQMMLAQDIKIKVDSGASVAVPSPEMTSRLLEVNGR